MTTTYYLDAQPECNDPVEFCFYDCLFTDDNGEHEDTDPETLALRLAEVARSWSKPLGIDLESLASQVASTGHIKCCEVAVWEAWDQVVDAVAADSRYRVYLGDGCDLYGFVEVYRAEDIQA
jgi:hypothetical protein